SCTPTRSSLPAISFSLLGPIGLLNWHGGIPFPLPTTGLSWSGQNSGAVRHCASAFVQTVVAALRRVIIGLRTLPARRTAYACQHEPDRRAAGICRRLGCVTPRHRCDRLRSVGGAVGITRRRLRRRAAGNRWGPRAYARRPRPLCLALRRA